MTVLPRVPREEQNRRHNFKQFFSRVLCLRWGVFDAAARCFSRFVARWYPSPADSSRLVQFIPWTSVRSLAEQTPVARTHLISSPNSVIIRSVKGSCCSGGTKANWSNTSAAPSCVSALENAQGINPRYLNRAWRNSAACKQRLLMIKYRCWSPSTSAGVNTFASCLKSEITLCMFHQASRRRLDFKQQHTFL